MCVDHHLLNSKTRKNAFNFDINYRSRHSNNNTIALSQQHMSSSSLSWPYMAPQFQLPFSKLFGKSLYLQWLKSIVSALPFHSHSDIRSLQDADPLLQEFLPFWRRQVRPTTKDRWKVSKPALALLLPWHRLVEENSLLYVWFSIMMGVRKLYSRFCLLSWNRRRWKSSPATWSSGHWTTELIREHC